MGTRQSEGVMTRVSIQEIRELTSVLIPGLSRQDWEGLAPLSYLHPNPLIRWLMWRRYGCIRDLGRFSPDMTVLEFGCGLGLFLPELDASCGKVFAFDTYPQYAELLCERRRLRVQFIESLVELTRNSLDAIIAADVLEHIPELCPTIDQFRGLLKPRGHLIVSSPTENVLYKAGRGVAGFGGKGGYHHRSACGVSTIILDRGFRLAGLRRLPFPFPPSLFMVHDFVAKDGPGRFQAV
jgi:2-polyprenyl-3-methyl-5-hydroxy-6-metoxy-1,4-benzoquinol methylase